MMTSKKKEENYRVTDRWKRNRQKDDGQMEEKKDQMTDGWKDRQMDGWTK